MLAQEIGLTEIRLSQLEQELGHHTQADDDMKHGQAKLTALGWQDVFAAPLIALITQLNSEYKPVDQKKNSAHALKHPKSLIVQASSSSNP